MRWARIALYSLLGLLAVLAVCVVVILNLDFGRDVKAAVERR